MRREGGGGQSTVSYFDGLSYTQVPGTTLSEKVSIVRASIVTPKPSLHFRAEWEMLRQRQDENKTKTKTNIVQYLHLLVPDMYQVSGMYSTNACTPGTTTASRHALRIVRLANLLKPQRLLLQPQRLLLQLLWQQPQPQQQPLLQLQYDRLLPVYEVPW